MRALIISCLLCAPAWGDVFEEPDSDTSRIPAESSETYVDPKPRRRVITDEEKLYQLRAMRLEILIEGLHRLALKNTKHPNGKTAHGPKHL